MKQGLPCGRCHTNKGGQGKCGAAGKTRPLAVFLTPGLARTYETHGTFGKSNNVR